MWTRLEAALDPSHLLRQSVLCLTGVDFFYFLYTMRLYRTVGQRVWALMHVFGYLSSYGQIAITFLQMAPSWSLLGVRILTHISLVLRKKGPCERSLLDKEMGPGPPKFLRQNLHECWGSKFRSSAFCGRHYTECTIKPDPLIQIFKV